MDINQLEVLVAVAREKSFSRAAETLHRTQPAVSQAIRRLEAELGEPLFDRSSKDGTLTAAGRVVFDVAQQILNLRHGAHSALKELKDLHRGKLTLSANEYTVMYLLPVLHPIPIAGLLVQHLLTRLRVLLFRQLPQLLIHVMLLQEPTQLLLL